MKRLMLATVSAIAVISARPGLAADLRMPVKAPPPAAVRAFSWTGCYLGGHVGWGWGRKTISDTPNGDLVDFFTPGPATSLDADVNGFLGGGQIGCDFQLGSNFVLGAEGNLAWSDIKGTSASFDGGGGPGSTPTTFHAKIDWLASLTGRVGYAIDHWLVYAKGGVAWAHENYEFRTYLATWSASESARTGWTVGGGLEWAFADHWSTKIEYQYYDFGSRDLRFDPHDARIALDTENVKQQLHTIKGALSYRF